MHDPSRPCSGTGPACVSLLTAAILALLPMAARAATPGAGDILQQTQPQKPPAPSSTGTGLSVPAVPKAQLPAGVSFHVTKIEITGNTLFPASTLHALVADGEGKTRDLQQLEVLAQRITAYYQRHGYSLSRAIIPAQQIRGGIVRLQVIEARYGRIGLNNRSRASAGLLQSTLSPLQSGRIIGDHELDRALLLLSDIPGVESHAVLKPGATVGTSELDVEANAVPMVTGHLSADNFGNRSTGEARVGGGVAIYNLLHLGDVLNLDLMTAGRGLDYGRASYDTVLNGHGTRAGVSYSAMHYNLGGTLSNLRGYGSADVGSGWLRQPLIRSRTLNLYAQAQLDYKKLRDHIDATGIRTDRHLSDGSLSLSGDVRDNWLVTNAVTSWNAAWTSGKLVFDDATAAVADAATANTAGNFSKWNASLARLQALNARNSLYLQASGQWTNRNLDSVEKLVVGGPYSVRGYDMGVLSADTGYLVTAELRHQFDARWQVKAFWDSEHARVNGKPWIGGVNKYTLADAGLGVELNAPHQWKLEGYVASPVGSVPAAVTSNNRVHGWVKLSKLF